MPFRVTAAAFLKSEGDRIESILFTPTRIRQTWTRETLQEELRRIGLDYSDREIAALNDELHRRGVVADVT